MARKEKNRQAASRSRKRKQDRLDELDVKMRQQTQEIETLKFELTDALEKLRRVDGGAPGCEDDVDQI
jgi:hypothetical protein